MDHDVKLVPAAAVGRLQLTSNLWNEKGHSEATGEYDVIGSDGSEATEMKEFLEMSYLCVLAQCRVGVADGLHLLFKQTDGLCHGDPQPQPVIHRAKGARLLRRT